MYNAYTLTLDQLCDLIRSGDDTHHNQIRIKDNGDIFLSRDVGPKNLDGIRGRFETFVAGHGYVGPGAADDLNFMKRIFAAIQDWTEAPCLYIDVF